jgi:SAM-dependent methyltransferase
MAQPLVQYDALTSVPRSGLGAQFAHPRGFWGALVGHVMAVANAQPNRWLLDQLSLYASDHVLEIGFGPGIAIEAASRIVTEGKVVGVDISETMLRQASRRNAPGIGRGQVELHRASAAALPLEDGAFDSVFSFNTVQFCEDLEAAVREMRRVVRPGGAVAIAIQPRGRGTVPTSSAAWARRLQLAMDAAGLEEITEHFGPPDNLPVACVIGRNVARRSGRA